MHDQIACSDPAPMPTGNDEATRDLEADAHAPSAPHGERTLPDTEECAAPRCSAVKATVARMVHLWMLTPGGVHDVPIAGMVVGESVILRDAQDLHLVNANALVDGGKDHWLLDHFRTNYAGNTIYNIPLYDALTPCQRRSALESSRCVMSVYGAPGGDGTVRVIAEWPPRV